MMHYLEYYRLDAILSRLRRPRLTIEGHYYAKH
jgi:hypothetical protein